MPRSKKPKSLRKLSMNCLISTILKECQESDGKDVEHIWKKVHDIPSIFANEYMHDLLMIASRSCDKIKLRGAFHFYCTQIDLEEATFELSPRVFDQLFANMDMLMNLGVLKTGHPNMLTTGVRFAFSRMPKLTCLHLPSPLHPGTVSNIIRNCPRLEDIRLRYISTKELKSLPFECNKLKKIELRKEESWIPTGVAMHLLENLQNLESLRIDNMVGMLELCTDVYSLKDFVEDVHPRDSMMLIKLVYHFPELHHLSLQLRYRNLDLSPVNTLVNLKNLEVSHGSATSLICLIDVCFPRLIAFSCKEVTELHCLFGPDINLPGVKSIKLQQTGLVDLPTIGEIFSNLERIELLDGNVYTTLPHNMSDMFQDLTTLKTSSLLVTRQMCCLMPSGHKLKTLHVHDESCDEHDFLDLLQAPSLQKLHTLSLTSADQVVTKAMASHILESLGDDLCKLTLNSKIISMSNAEYLALERELQKYDMSFHLKDGHYWPWMCMCICRGG